MGDLAEPAHHVWRVPIMNTRRVSEAEWAQSMVRCRCGWSRIVIAPGLGDEYGRLHYLRHGVAARAVPYGLPGDWL